MAILLINAIPFYIPDFLVMSESSSGANEFTQTTEGVQQSMVSSSYLISFKIADNTAISADGFITLALNTVSLFEKTIDFVWKLQTLGSEKYPEKLKFATVWGRRSFLEYGQLTNRTFNYNTTDNTVDISLSFESLIKDLNFKDSEEVAGKNDNPILKAIEEGN